MQELQELPRVKIPGYSEKASTAEMVFAGRYLNLVGMGFFGLGVLYSLRVTAKQVSTGLIPVVLGLLAGLVLLVMGHINFTNDRRQLGETMLGGGLVLALVSGCAGHFTFGLYSMSALFVYVMGLVVWAGLAVFRYQSKLLGNLCLAGLFFGPLVMDFDLSRVGAVLAYLAAINLGTTLVAYQNKWDYQLIVAFLGSYALFLSHFGLTRYPVLTLAFLTGIYGLFLVANNLIYFVREEVDDFNLLLSYVNPVAYAAVSYYALVKLANGWSLALYLGLAAVHLGLARLSYQSRGRGRHFLDMAINHLALGILFFTSAISFIANFSTGVERFELVTFLWFALMIGIWMGEGLLLLAAGRSFPELASTLRRPAYLCLTLAVVQLFWVVPEMPGSVSRIVLQLLASLLFALFARQVLQQPESSEQRASLYLAVVASVAAAGGALGSVPWCAPLTAILAGLALVEAGLRFSWVGLLRYPGVVLAAVAGVRLLVDSRTDFPILVVGLACALVLAVWTARLDRWHWSASLGSAGLAVALLAKLSLVMTSWDYALIPVALALIAWLGALLLEQRPALKPLTLALAGAAAGLSVVLALAGQFQLGSASAVMVVLAQAAWKKKEPLWAGAAVAAASPVAISFDWALGLGMLAFGCLLVSHHCPELEELSHLSPMLLGLAAVSGSQPWPLVVLASLAAGLTFPHLRCRYSALAAAGLTVFELPESAAVVGLVWVVLAQRWSVFDIRWGEGILMVTAGYCLVFSSSLLATSLVLTCLLASSFAKPGQPVAVASLLLALKAAFLVSASSASTALWVALGLALLSRGQRLAHPVLALAFMKSVVLDANFVLTGNQLELALVGQWTGAEVAATGMVTVGLWWATRWCQEVPDELNLYRLLAQMAFAFHATLALYQLFGILDPFQILLSLFWCLTSFFFIAFGVFREVRVSRLFGLVTLVGSVVKICAVDIWVLQAYNVVGTLCIMGAILMVVSFLYQSHSDHLVHQLEEVPAL